MTTDITLSPSLPINSNCKGYLLWKKEKEEHNPRKNKWILFDWLQVGVFELLQAIWFDWELGVHPLDKWLGWILRDVPGTLLDVPGKIEQPLNICLPNNNSLSCKSPSV